MKFHVDHKCLMLERLSAVDWLYRSAVLFLRLVAIARWEFFTTVANISYRANQVKTLLELVYSFVNSEVSSC